MEDYMSCAAWAMLFTSRKEEAFFERCVLQRRSNDSSNTSSKCYTDGVAHVLHPHCELLFYLGLRSS